MFHSFVYQTVDGEDSILVSDFKTYKNHQGRWCYSFVTPNHRTLLRGNQGFKGDSRSLTFETEETAVVSLNDRESCVVPLASVTVWIHPETEDEADEIENATYCVLPKKNEQIVLIVPLNDFLAF